MDCNVSQLSGSSSENDDNFEDVVEEPSGHTFYSNSTGNFYSAPSNQETRRTAKRISCNSNEEESDNISTTSANNSDIDFGFPAHLRNERSLSLQSEDSERNDSVKDEEMYSGSSKPPPFYSPTEKEFESNDDDVDSSTSASCSDVDRKCRKTSCDEIDNYTPQSYSYYGSTDADIKSEYKDQESSDKESDGGSSFSKYSGRFTKFVQSKSKRKEFDESSSYTPKKRFKKSDSDQNSSGSDFSSLDGKRKSECTNSEDEVNSEPPPVKSKSLSSHKPSGIVSKMMAKMGYASGKGLGKYDQGVVEPVKVSSQRGKRGLGLTLKGLEEEDVEWDFDSDEISIIESLDWLECTDEEILTLKPTLQSWMRKDEKKMHLDDEDHFCDPEILKETLENKSIFDKLASDEMRKARNRANPFESIRNGIFLNRAAMKMANMDKRFDFMFTDPQSPEGEPMVKSNELLYFADVCAGPGGFSEYVFWRKKWRAKGFGMTLKESNDFKLDDFFAGPCESFEAHYGENDDGNVYTPANIESFQSIIFEQTEDKGVHFMMADGGFSVEGQENIQEILSKQLYLCQCLVALYIVRTGGHFVTKLFDLFTPFSAGIIYLMYRCFKKISIFKPNSSRPANSERYLVCKWKHDEAVIKDIRFYLSQINKLLINLGNQNEEKAKHKLPLLDVVECVALDALKSDKTFYSYLVDSNNKLAKRQISNLKKVIAFVKNSNLHEERQKELRDKCLEYWDVPNETRKSPKTTVPSSRLLKTLLEDDNIKFTPTSITNEEKSKEVKFQDLSKMFQTSIYDWQCVSLHDVDKATLFYCQGRKRIHRWEGSNFSEVSADLMPELSPGSLIYGELVYEFIGEGKGLRKNCAFHIIDAYQLGDEVIGGLKYSNRYERCKLFCKAMTRREYPVRMKVLHNMYELSTLFHERLALKQLKNVSIHRLCFPIPPLHYEVNGLLFLCLTHPNFGKHWSKSNKCFYYYDKTKRTSKFENEATEEVFNNFTSTMQQLKSWSWKQYSEVRPPPSSFDELLKFVKSSSHF